MKRALQNQMTFFFLVLVSCSLVSKTNAGQKAYLGNKAPSQKASFDRFDHKPWDTLLKKYVDKDGLVNYRALKASTQDMAVLDQYLQQLSSAAPEVKATKEGTLAFWINAYNAVTLRGMLHEYPTKSIKNHTKLSYNIWKDLLLYVGGKPYSLDDMEHKVLRKMSEPRIHFAVVCASIGCPRLLNEAYVGEKVEEQLELNARDFFSRPAHFRNKGSQLGLSSILKWYGDDFGRNQSEQLQSYARWLPTKQAQRLAQSGRASVSYLEYDWAINEQPTKR